MMKPIKVYYHVYSLTSGGIEKYSINLYKYLNHNKIDIDFITKLDRHEFFDDELYAMGGNKIAISAGCRSGKIAHMIDFCRNAFRIADTSYDVAYFNLSSPSAVFKYPLICRLKGIHKIIIHSHNSSEESKGFVDAIINFWGRLYINKIASEKFACSDKAAAWMYGNKCVQNQAYKNIKNGIETAQYRYDVRKRKIIRNELNFDDNTIVVGHIGRFEKQKNHSFMVDIMEKLVKQNNNIKMVFIGVGSLQNMIISKVEEKGLSENVVFLGERNDISMLLQGMDLFILPSLYEGLPVVGVEAQASGLKCLFSDVITREADFTGNVTFLPLEDKAWIGEIANYKLQERYDMTERVISSGYDIKSTVQNVETIIKDLANR